MESAWVHEPKQDHPVDGWFEPAVAARLSAAGLSTIGQLIALIERRGPRWHTAVPRLGPRGAQRLTDWLLLNADALGHALSPSALTPRRQLKAGAQKRGQRNMAELAPLEALDVPAELDGSLGSNRVPLPNPIGANTDLRAIRAWFSERGGNAHTSRAYRREAERLLLWALHAKRKPLSSLTRADCTEYLDDFLRDPQPADFWVNPDRSERARREWKPFAGPLSDRSRETARSILKAMCRWLVDQGYLQANPFDGLARAAEPAPFDATGRTLDHAEWRFMLGTVSREQYTLAQHRDFLALLLAYATGLRRAELAEAVTGRLVPAADGRPDWSLTVPGRKGIARTASIPAVVAEEARRNFRLRGLGEPLACPPQTPLLAHARTGQPLSPDGLGRIFKVMFEEAARAYEVAFPGKGRAFARASTHWLRHTHSHHALDQGADLRRLSENLGHASVTTTAEYLKGSHERRVDLMEARLLDALGGTGKS
jgi:site-specific recombinase XerD